MAAVWLNLLFLDLVGVEGSWLLSEKVLSFSKTDFDDFYEQWLKVSGRENSIDEYGQLLHLNNFFSRLNSANHKVVLQESI
ncbi:hypothetical protein [Enterovibrio baiacu]|uniref:hypothetical protein n=1 Tax=Enterovibrio baiacu TaxID=2491023 RepID=UPI003D127EFB